MYYCGHLQPLTNLFGKSWVNPWHKLVPSSIVERQPGATVGAPARCTSLVAGFYFVLGVEWSGKRVKGCVSEGLLCCGAGLSLISHLGNGATLIAEPVVLSLRLWGQSTWSLVHGVSCRSLFESLAFGRGDGDFDYCMGWASGCFWTLWIWQEKADRWWESDVLECMGNWISIIPLI